MSYTIFDLAQASDAGGPAARTRVQMARHALSLDGFEEDYRRLLSRPNAAHHEMYHHLDFEDQTPGYLTSIDVSLEEGYRYLGVLAEKYLSSKSTDDLEIASSVVAAELWCAVHPTPELFGEVNDAGLHLAAYYGPDSVSAASAIVARAAGMPNASFPLDPEWPELCYSMPLLKHALSVCRGWIENLNLSWRTILSNASQDLGWQTCLSRSHELSLILARIVETSCHD